MINLQTLINRKTSAMKKTLFTFIFSIIAIGLPAQEESALRLIHEPIESKELQDILHFEGIHYLKIKFIGGEALKTKSYRIRG